MCSGGEKSKNPPNFFGPSNTNVFCLTTDTAEICTTHTLSTSGYYKNIRAILKCFLWRSEERRVGKKFSYWSTLEGLIIRHFQFFHLLIRTSGVPSDMHHR